MRQVQSGRLQSPALASQGLREGVGLAPSCTKCRDGARGPEPGRSVDEAGGEEEAEAADSVAVAGCSGENGESGRGVSPVCVLVGVELGGVKMSDAEGEGAGKGEAKESAAGAADGAGEEGTAAAAAGGACSASVVVPVASLDLIYDDRVVV